MKYYVTEQGNVITKALTIAEIIAQFGPIKELEANGFRLIAV
jgi:hypothetical protein